MSLLQKLFGISSMTSVRGLIIPCLAWTFLVYIFVTKLFPQPTVETDKTIKRITQAMELLEESRQRNEELQQKIATLLNDQVDKHSVRKLIEELEYKLQNTMAVGGKTDSPIFYGNPFSEPSVYSELGQLCKKVGHEPTNVENDINNVLTLGAEHKRSLLSDMDRLRQLDGYEAWRYKESKDLSDLVQRRLRYLQNPPDCSKAKKLICELNKGCGYGCQLHHAVYCLITAYATERTLILESEGFLYHKSGWEEVFRPVSDTCVDIREAILIYFPGTTESQILVLPTIESLWQRLPYLPLALPEDLASRMKRLHSEPYAWWVGQFLQYLLRPQKSTQEFLEASTIKLGFKRPIVGVHVRRTDKVGTEAAFHSFDEYMSYVEDYYLTQETNGTSLARRIFLATDDAKVIDEARKKYIQYEIISDAEVARTAFGSTRYTENGLYGIVLDIHLMSISDYLVCTFSSHVCRVAYEIMQTHYPDAGHRFKSLDDIYYFGGQNEHNLQAVIPHTPRNHDELHMKPGDLVGVAGNHWNGFSKGKNTRTNQVGLFPSFKVVNKIKTFKVSSNPNTNIIVESILPRIY